MKQEESKTLDLFEDIYSIPLPFEIDPPSNINENLFKIENQEEKEKQPPQKKRRGQNAVRTLNRKFNKTAELARPIQPSDESDIRFLLVEIRLIPFQKRQSTLFHIFEDIKKEQSHIQPSDKRRMILESLRTAILEQIDLNDEMDIENNLQILRYAGKERRRQDKTGKYTQNAFLEYEMKFTQ